MNAFLKKEIRLLLPAFLFALAIAVVSIFFHGENGGWLNNIGYFLECIFFPAIVIMLALNSFGAEVGTQMFVVMLAQPVERQRVWQTKIVLLVIAMAAIAVIWVISAIVPTAYFQRSFTSEDEANALAVVILFGLVVFSGALWTVLLLRQVSAAFWFTLIVPGSLLALTAIFCSGSSDEFILAMATVVLGAYSLAGFFFARWLFFRAQDLQWTGGTIVLPEWRGFGRTRTAAGETPRLRRPHAALWRKEIQLQQSQFVIAFVLAVLHLGVIATRNFFDFQSSPDLKAVLEGFWVLWLVMPFLVGCAAVAEERKIGAHEGQLCLPAKRRTQFIIKFLVTIGLSLFLGALMPALLEISKVLQNLHGMPGSPWELSKSLLLLLSIPALTSAISFYVSTMARNTLQTLAPAVLGVIVVWPCIIIVTSQVNAPYDYLWRGPLGIYIILPTLAITLLLLAYFNFQRVLTGWSVVARNLLTILCAAALGVILTSATYHRFWEKLIPFEPAHGAPRLSLSQPATFEPERFNNSTVLSLRLPDNRIWTSAMMFEPTNFHSLAFFKLGNFKVSLVAPEYAQGTNWTALKHTYWFTAGIKNDGTLWVSRNTPVLDSFFSYAKNKDRLNDLVQFGNETDWKSLVPMHRELLLIKQDGTLWTLGENKSKPKDWPGLAAYTPRRIGNGSDWAGVTQCCFGYYVYKTDGTAWSWIWGDWDDRNKNATEIAPGLFLHAVPGLDHGRMQSTATISHGLEFGIGVRDDGTFRIWAHQRRSSTTRSEFVWSFTDQQIGTDTNWVAVAGNWDKAVTLRSDGTLWLWDFRRTTFRDWDPLRFDAEVAKTVPVRLSKHSDWIAVSGSTALAADGSLWYWPLMSANELWDYLRTSQDADGNHENWQPLLDISRKPQLLGNVFSAAN